MKRFALIGGLAIASSAYGQQVDCAKFTAAIESDLKTLSSGAMASGKNQFRDAILSSVASTNIHSNLLIMQANKCKLPIDPISSSYYIQNALDCSMREAYGTNEERDAVCSMNKWERKK
ncbi:MAG TPA: hypothetical protein VJ654_03035 [Noviherbaspirillum sp.]|nr:hypothetical protein [Noviherbaspirillum sp.]